MNEDYFDLDRNPVQLLLVACINEYDPTGISNDKANTWLRSLCDDLEGWASIASAETAAAKVELAVKHPAPAIDLAQIGLAQVIPPPSPSPGSSTSSGLEQPTASRADQIRLIQFVLCIDGYALPGVTGVLDRPTITAIEHYERNNGLPVNGKLNQTLLQHISSDEQSVLSFVAK